MGLLHLQKLGPPFSIQEKNKIVTKLNCHSGVPHDLELTSTPELYPKSRYVDLSLYTQEL